MMEYSPEENPIVIKCKAHQTMPIDQLVEFQGNLKRLSEKNRTKLVDSICTRGFIAPFFAWDDTGGLKLLDGHQRLKTLLWMRQKGWDIPMLPVDLIEADSIDDAKSKLLAITSQYGEFTVDGFIEFTTGIELSDNIRLTDSDWSVDHKENESIDDEYTHKIDAPIYEVTGEKPTFAEMVDKEKAEKLIEQINKSKLADEEKEFLILASKRHIVFDYHKIAEYYAHASQEVQELMEKSALVIIDFNKAIENGYARLSQKTIDRYEEEYNDED